MALVGMAVFLRAEPNCDMFAFPIAYPVNIGRNDRHNDAFRACWDVPTVFGKIPFDGIDAIDFDNSLPALGLGEPHSRTDFRLHARILLLSSTN